MFFLVMFTSIISFEVFKFKTDEVSDQKLVNTCITQL